MASSASTFGSASMRCTLFSNDSGVAEAIMSTGFLTLASGGRNSRSAAMVASASAGSSSPWLSHASLAMIAGPPAFVTMPTRAPRGSGWFASSIATSNNSSIVSVRITPDEAARAPERVRPLLTAAIGFFRATRRAICVKRRGFPNDSR